ncbi:MAG: GNAT family N-acetyltransferase [Anaerolineales bacterium]|nr:GNAT family N-acetyltransferase [Anaerolineales bacterium]
MKDWVFETDRLYTRKARKDDLEMYVRLWNSAEVMKYVGFPLGLGVTEEEVLQKMSIQQGGPFNSLLVIVKKESDEVLGECKMYTPDPQGISSTDLKLLPEYWGNHYGMEIKQGLVKYLFSRTDCRAVESTPNVENIASIKIQEAIGGVREIERTYNFPEEMQSYTTPVHHYVYRIYREKYVKGNR